MRWLGRAGAMIAPLLGLADQFYTTTQKSLFGGLVHLNHWQFRNGNQLFTTRVSARYTGRVRMSLKIFLGIAWRCLQPRSRLALVHNLPTTTSQHCLNTSHLTPASLVCPKQRREGCKFPFNLLCTNKNVENGEATSLQRRLILIDSVPNSYWTKQNIPHCAALKTCQVHWYKQI